MTESGGKFRGLVHTGQCRRPAGVFLRAVFLPFFIPGFKTDVFCGLGRRRWRPMTVEEMKSVDVRTVDRDSLVDVTRIHIDEGLTMEERLREFVRQVKNPYCFRVGDVVVKNVYSSDGVSLRERFEQYAGTL